MFCLVKSSDLVFSLFLANISFLQPYQSFTKCIPDFAQPPKILFWCWQKKSIYPVPYEASKPLVFFCSLVCLVGTVLKDTKWRRIAATNFSDLTLSSALLRKNVPFDFQVAIGDRDGVLQVFASKRGEISHAFKTLPGQEITRVELGGALGNLQFFDLHI